MSPRAVTAVVGVAFFLAGLLIMLLPLSTDSPSGFSVACGNSVGMGFDPVAVEAEGAAFVEICGRLRLERLAWAAPVCVLGALLVVGSIVVRRRSSA
ncbi:hypothetical protein ADK67_30630 [Saccharothrix sp. NRRL B-16348]|uniref:hypothetical protein n=1 Tax=Saccharothrix sp. NRRL B-16348 TaxID=1415542 RepID=UPI0006AEA509|nr:hypothetical protein [Saccharothrix sp. NRRL B-16348]KOX20225.1 hypothetical protein ADK67_30630 [Saccharothrix sp. NRRL B-16348]